MRSTDRSRRVLIEGGYFSARSVQMLMVGWNASFVSRLGYLTCGSDSAQGPAARSMAAAAQEWRVSSLHVASESL